MLVENKVALVTGGASGIGLVIVKELLKNHIKAVVIADINEKLGEDICKQLNEEYGDGKVIFIKTDVSNKEQFENAMKKTIETFKHFDILVNNAGILNDKLYEKQVLINLTAVIHGCRLAMDTYIKIYKSSTEGLIINIASILGLEGSSTLPLYSATKHGVIGLSKSLSSPLHYNDTKVKIITICPGFTSTPLLNVPEDNFFNPSCLTVLQNMFADPNFVLQSLDNLSKAIIPIINQGENGSIWVVDGDNISSVYIPQIKELEKIDLKL